MTAPQGESKARQITLEHIEQRILSGEYRVGSILPPERELATELGVSRGAVREAIRVLQAYGILESQPGRGRGTMISAGQSSALGKVFSLHLATAQQTQADLVEARVAFERGTAALACRHATDGALRAIEQLLKAMDESTQPARFNDLDTEFHMAIARAARNPLLTDLTIAIREAQRQPILDASVRMQDWPRFRLTLITEHRGIFEAIKDRTPDLAARRAEMHIRRSSKELGTLW